MDSRDVHADSVFRSRRASDRSAPVGGLPLRSNPELVREWVAWLRAFRWHWWATLAFRRPHHPDGALRAAAEWLAPLARADAAVGLQRGPRRDRLPRHARIRGTRRHPPTPLRVRQA